MPQRAAVLAWCRRHQQRALVVAAQSRRRFDWVLQLTELIAHRDHLARGGRQRVDLGSGARGDDALLFEPRILSFEMMVAKLLVLLSSSLLELLIRRLEEHEALLA